MLLETLKQKAQKQVNENVGEVFRRFLKSFEEELPSSLPFVLYEHKPFCNCFYCQALKRLTKAYNNYKDCLIKYSDNPPHHNVDNCMALREIYGYQREFEWWLKKFNSATEKLKREEVCS